MDALARLQLALNDVDPLAWKEDLTEDDMRQLAARLARAEAVLRALDRLADEDEGVSITAALIPRTNRRTLGVRVGTELPSAAYGGGATLPAALADVLEALDVREPPDAPQRHGHLRAALRAEAAIFAPKAAR